MEVALTRTTAIRGVCNLHKLVVKAPYIRNAFNQYAVAQEILQAAVSFRGIPEGGDLYGDDGADAVYIVLSGSIQVSDL